MEADVDTKMFSLRHAHGRRHPHRDHPHRDHPHRDHPHRDHPHRDHPHRRHPRRIFDKRHRGPTLEDRLVAHMLAPWLDQELANGGQSLSKVHAARAKQLTSERMRQRVARTLDRLIECAGEIRGRVQF